MGVEAEVQEVNTQMLKVALNLHESDAESLVDSAESSGSEEKDWLKGFAQRATDPYIKARKAKGPFVYIKPRFRPGKHVYVDEEIARTKDAYEEDQLRQRLKGAQYKVTGVVSFDKHGQPKGFKVQDVAGGKPAGISQEQLDASFANEIAQRAATSDPVYEEAVYAAQSRAKNDKGPDPVVSAQFQGLTISPSQYETPSGFPPGTAPSTAPQPTQIDPNGAQILRLEPPPPSPEAEASLSIPPALPYQPSAPQSSIGPGPNTPAQGTPGTAPPSSPYQRPPPSADAHARAHTSSRGGQEGRHTPQERDRRGDARKGRGHSIGRHHTSESRRGGYGEAETYGRHSSSHRHSSRQDRGHREERRHHRDRHAHEHVRGERGEEKGGHERREVHGYRGSGWREGGERERGERRRPHHHSEHRRRDDDVEGMAPRQHSGRPHRSSRRDSRRKEEQPRARREERGGSKGQPPTEQAVQAQGRALNTVVSKKSRAKQPPPSESDSSDSFFPGMDAVLASEEAAHYLRPAVSDVSSIGEPDPDAPPRSRQDLHSNSKARQIRESRKPRWTSSEDELLAKK